MNRGSYFFRVLKKKQQNSAQDLPKPDDKAMENKYNGIKAGEKNVFTDPMCKGDFHEHL